MESSLKLIACLLVSSAGWASSPIQSPVQSPAQSSTQSPVQKIFNLPYQDASLDFETRVQDLVSRMTFEEKILQMQNDAPEISRLGVPSYNWWNEALHGVARAGIATVFPQAIGLAAAWDRDLHHQVAQVISDEGRAKHHEFVRQGSRKDYQGLNFWSPNINIFRDPRWGRGQETYGEDPYLTGELAVQFVKGLQGDDAKYFKSIATPKHFAVHSAPEKNRYSFNAVVSEHDFRDTYLRAFEKAVRVGGAYSVMSAYNAINGVPAPANSRLLDEILRKEWGFKGFVVSDCGAVGSIVWQHHYTRTLSQAAAASVRAGTDLTCGTEYESLSKALQNGEISEIEVNTAVSRLMMGRMKLGMFDDDSLVAYAQIPMSVVDQPKNREVARLAAVKSIVLLKNDGLLPLKKTITSVAVIGPNADDADLLLGNYNGTPSKSVTPLQGIRNLLAGARKKSKLTKDVKVYYAHGSDRENSFAQEIKEAVSAASKSEVAIVFVGLSQQQEGENQDGMDGDRSKIELPDAQEKLIQAVRGTGTPTVVVYLSGGPAASVWAQGNVNAILSAWYPGEEGGTAIAQILFGAENPSGRLPVTYYRSTTDLPALTDYSMANRTYRFFKGNALYPFGFGLSYAKFKYSHLQIKNSPLMNADLTVTADIKNDSDRPGEEVVEAYLRNENGLSYLPKFYLVQFARVSLKAHEQKTVSLTIRADDFSYFDSRGYRQLQAGSFVLSVGGQQPSGLEPQDQDNLLMTRINLQ